MKRSGITNWHEVDGFHKKQSYELHLTDNGDNVFL